jgi:hypothetical protein
MTRMDYDQTIDGIDELITQLEDKIEKLREVRTTLEELRDAELGLAAPAKAADPSKPARRERIAERAGKTDGAPPAKTTPGKRRKFDDETKAAILEEIAQARKSGEKGAVTKVLQRHSLSAGTLSQWENPR